MQEIYTIIGKRIAAKRLECQLSQLKLAEITDLNKNYIGNIERAEKHVTIRTLQRLAKALNCKMEYFFKDL